METKTIATKQANPKAGKNGNVPPKERQFGQPNGNRRNNGAWKKEDTARYKLEQIGKLTETEVAAIANDKSAGMLERRIARSLLKENDWKTTESMINQIYGKPKETVETVDKTPRKIEVEVKKPTTGRVGKKSAEG